MSEKQNRSPFRTVRIAEELGLKIDQPAEELGWKQNKFISECVRAIIEMADQNEAERVVPRVVMQLDAMRQISEKEAKRIKGLTGKEMADELMRDDFRAVKKARKNQGQAYESSE